MDGIIAEQMNSTIEHTESRHHQATNTKNLSLVNQGPPCGVGWILQSHSNPSPSLCHLCTVLHLSHTARIFRSIQACGTHKIYKHVALF